MALAIAVGVAGSVVADVELALARIDDGDSATWPNMAPKVRYFFIPVLAGAVVVAAVAVNLLLTLIDHRRTELLRHWVFVGAAYGLVASALPMRYLGLSISSLHKKGPAKAVASNRALSPAGNVGVERGRRGYFSS
jgi:hypothetical protein